MTEATAIIAGSGRLPGLLARHLTESGQPFSISMLDGHPFDDAHSFPADVFRIEELALLFARLRARGVGRVVFAGAVRRPAIDPARIDPATAALLPRLMPAFGAGDDALLRAVIALFEAAGFDVVGAADILPELVPARGVLTRAQPAPADQADAARAAELVRLLGQADLGQGAVVAQGLCLALETLPGTGPMLDWVAEVAVACRPDPGGARGVFLKAPKPGQELRIDMPAIGPDTVTAVARADLAGIVIETGVMVLDRPETVAAADAAGLFIWAR